MKKNIFLFSSVVIFVVLFYHQWVGINLSIFCLFAWITLLFNMNKAKSGNVFRFLSAATIISVIAFAWYGDFLSFAALIVSMFATAYNAYYPKLNIITVPAGLAFNYMSAVFRILMFHKWLNLKIAGAGFFKKLIGNFIVPFLLASVFLLVYAAASSKFASFFRMDWDVDFFEIAMLTILSFFIMFGFYHFAVPKLLIYYNSYLKDDFSETYEFKPSKRFSVLDLASQRRSGEISLILLNAVLIFFIITYSIEQFGNGQASGNISDDVHERVYVFMLSIAMAIVVIMIFFGGAINFDKKALLLKGLSLVWIALNILLVAIVVFRNTEYVHAFGLTFKRIGVFIFLLLCICGLLITYYKIMFRKTNIFLINRMFWCFFSTLIISSSINWSWAVTKYNISNFREPDWSYLRSLNYNKKILAAFKKPAELDSTTFYDDVNKEKDRPFLSNSFYYLFLNVK